jgi:hypothetical protein
MGISAPVKNISGNAGTVSTLGANSLLNDGFQKMPGGLIFQWGIRTLTTDSIGSVVINLPIAFTSKNLFVSLTPIKGNPNNGPVQQSTSDLAVGTAGLTQLILTLPANTRASFYFQAIGI